MRSSGSNAKNGLKHHSVVLPSAAIDLFWDLLVAYANIDSDLPSRWKRLAWTNLVPTHKSAFDRVTHLLLASGFVFGLLQINAEFDPNAPGIPEDLTDQIFRKTSKQLKQHHAIFKSVLAWMCSPSSGRVPDVREMRRLWRERNPSVAGPMVLIPGRYPMISEEDQRFVSFLEKHAALSIKSRLYLLDSSQTERELVLRAHGGWKNAVDPFCAFLLEQSLGKPFRELPVKLCTRPMCGRFFLPGKNTGKFCTGSCRARNFWTPKKRSDYMRIYRLRNLSPGARRKKLRDKLRRNS